MTAALMALATVLSAWCAYQATRWDGIQTIAFNAPVAGQLGVTRAELRRLIEQWELAEDVNHIRNHYRRSVARFRDVEHIPFRYRVYEKRLPPHY